jgi:hypothetical protein
MVLAVSKIDQPVEGSESSFRSISDTGFTTTTGYSSSSCLAPVWSISATVQSAVLSTTLSAAVANTTAATTAPSITHSLAG